MNQVERARVALSVTFVANGLSFAELIARAPALRDRLGLSSPQLGLLLLGLSGGAVTALPLSGPLVHRWGAKRSLLGGCVSLTVGLLLVSLGLRDRSPLVVAAGFAVVGIGNAAWDVAMNVEGVEIERLLGRPILPRLHAGYSLGTVAGAGAGAACAALSVPLADQVTVTAGVVFVTVAIQTRQFLPASGIADVAAAAGKQRPWREPATLLLGLLTLSFALCEGIANDWLALTTKTSRHSSDALAAVVFGLFVLAMTLTRTFGGAALASRGRVPVLRLSAAVGLTGVVLVSAGPGTAAVGAGALLWGGGAALGFPVGMTAAADDPVGSALRLSVVSSVAYAAFLGGPPLVGGLTALFGLANAILLAAVSFLLAFALSSRAREAA